MISKKDLAKALQITYYIAQWSFNARYVKGSEKSDNTFLRICFVGLEQTFITNLAILFEKRKDTICFHHYINVLSDEGEEGAFKEEINNLIDKNEPKIKKLISLRSNDTVHRNAEIYSNLINKKIPKFPKPTLLDTAELLGIAERIISGIEFQEFNGHTKKQRKELGERTIQDWKSLLEKLNS